MKRIMREFDGKMKVESGGRGMKDVRLDSINGLRELDAMLGELSKRISIE